MAAARNSALFGKVRRCGWGVWFGVAGGAWQDERWQDLNAVATDAL
jgi:hypothetical protein